MEDKELETSKLEDLQKVYVNRLAMLGECYAKEAELEDQKESHHLHIKKLIKQIRKLSAEVKPPEDLPPAA